MEGTLIADTPVFKQQCRANEYQLQKADFSSARLCGSSLCGDVDHPNLVLTNPQFVETDLRLARCFGWKSTGGRFMRSRCAGTAFSGCDFVDVTFKGVTYFEADSPVMPARFTQSQLLYARFEGEILCHVVFKDCALRWAVFKDCDLRYARFLHCDLKDANFEHASMDGVNLSHSTLSPGQLKSAEADDWSTVGVEGTGLTIEALRGIA